MDVDWRTDLDRWLLPFVAALRHKTKLRICLAYIRICLNLRGSSSMSVGLRVPAC